METASKLKAATLAGLSAKARAALVLMTDDLTKWDVPKDVQRAFLVSLANDVKTSLDEALREDRLRAKAHPPQLVASNAA